MRGTLTAMGLAALAALPVAAEDLKPALSATTEFLSLDGQPLAAIALALQQVVGHPLRGFLAHAGQHAQRVDQLFKQRNTHVRTVCR